MTIPIMDQNFRAPVILLAEAKEGTQFPEWVQLLKTGTFTDPRYGKFQITEKMLSEMVTNFKSKVRGIDPAIDFKHESEAEAAAWLLDLEVRPGEKGAKGLWGKPDWTGAGQKALSEKTYRYLSADFNQNYKDNEAGKNHGCVLLGAALTNRPVIKGMQPVIQLSEGESMDLTPEQIAKLQELMKQLGCNSVDELISKVSGMKPKEEIEAKEVELKEKDTQLSEKSTKLTELTSQVKTLSEENVKLKNEKAVSDKEQVFNKMLSEGKAIPAQKDAFMSGDVMKFAELAPKGGVKTTEAGTEVGADDVVDGDEEKVLKLAEEKVKKGEAKDIGTGISMVLKEQKEATK